LKRKNNMKTPIVLFLTLFTFHASAQEDIAPYPVDAHPEITTGEEKEAEFPGGQRAMHQFIADNVEYPKSSRKKKEEGTVFVQFIIEGDGSLFDIKVIRGVSEALDNEAIRVVKLMPKWSPGESHGKVVRVKYTLPLNFRLE